MNKILGVAASATALFVSISTTASFGSIITYSMELDLTSANTGQMTDSNGNIGAWYYSRGFGLSEPVPLAPGDTFQVNINFAGDQRLLLTQTPNTYQTIGTASGQERIGLNFFSSNPFPSDFGPETQSNFTLTLETDQLGQLTVSQTSGCGFSEGSEFSTYCLYGGVHSNLTDSSLSISGLSATFSNIQNRPASEFAITSFGGLSVGAGEIAVLAGEPPPPPPEPDTRDVYGIFVGLYDGKDGSLFTWDGILPEANILEPLKGYHGEIMAKELRDVFETTVDGVVETALITGSAENGGVDPDTVYRQIEAFAQRMDSNDTLVLYVASHGGDATAANGFSGEYLDEATPTPGDEFIQLYGGLLWDDELTKVLVSAAEGHNFETWVLLDACESGGFWNNINSDFSDKGDLERVAKIGLFAAAREGEYSRIRGVNGRAYFSDALIDAFSSSLVDDGLISFDELTDYVNVRKATEFSDSNYELSLRVDTYGSFSDVGTLEGVAGYFIPGSFNPVSFKSADFGGALGSRIPNAVPEPTTLALFGLGLAGIGAVRRKKLRA